MNYTPNHAELGTELYLTARTYSRTFDKYARENGLTRARWTLLWTLKKRPGLKQNELAELFEIAPISLSRQVDSLEAEGLLERRRDPDDRRCFRLFLLPAADNIVAVLQSLSITLREQALEGLSRQEIDQFMTLLNRIRTNLNNGDL